MLSRGRDRRRAGRGVAGSNRSRAAAAAPVADRGTRYGMSRAAACGRAAPGHAPLAGARRWRRCRRAARRPPRRRRRSRSIHGCAAVCAEGAWRNLSTAVAAVRPRQVPPAPGLVDARQLVRVGRAAPGATGQTCRHAWLFRTCDIVPRCRGRRRRPPGGQDRRRWGCRPVPRTRRCVDDAGLRTQSAVERVRGNLRYRYQWDFWCARLDSNQGPTD